VDDQPDLLRLLRVTLAAPGREVLSASDFESAAKSIAHDQPCVVVLDLDLGGASGWDLLTSDLFDADARARVIVLTCDGSPEAKLRAAALGVAGLVEKPYRPLALMRQVDGILSARAR
jgi:DNA-binding response OmpR family regulator